MSLTLDRIRFQYPGGPPVLMDANLTVRAGESVAVMAPSGAGKSTALAIAGLLLPPSHGRVLIGGVVADAKRARRHLGSTIAWLPQSVNLLPRRTVIDNVMLAGLSRGIDRHRARIDAHAHLERVDLAMAAGRQARTLSGGEAQRAGIARALVTSPALVIADEPTASLDDATAVLVAHLLVSAARGTTLLIATHDTRVADVVDRVVVLRGGVFTEVARP